jgi:hypothetical protein
VRRNVEAKESVGFVIITQKNKRKKKKLPGNNGARQSGTFGLLNQCTIVSIV